MFEIFVLGLIAVFVFFRLHAVLGQRTGHEKPSRSLFDIPADTGEPSIIPAHRVQRVRKKKEAPLPIPSTHPCAETLGHIALQDKTFGLDLFVSGAQAAFEIIMKAFTEGKIETLKKLLDKTLYQDFSRALKERKEQGTSLSIQILGFDDVQIIDASLDKKTAYITVRYDTQQKISQSLPDQEAQDTTDNVIDIWTFSKDLRSANPNWTLISTHTEHPSQTHS